MSEKRIGLSRIISDQPIYSKYEGLCSVCKDSYYPGEQISPYFEYDKNYFRHTACLQLYFIVFKYVGECNTCMSEIKRFSEGYWSKHNGIWCIPCGETLRPKVSIAFSRQQEDIKNKISNYA